jgi:3',5'-cyclic-AMP phosphodiesterase
MAMTTLIAQLSDPHIREPGRLAYGRIDTAPYLRRAAQAVMALKQRPDAVILTGDLTDFGRAEEYTHLAELLRDLDMPVYLLPGNHDDRDQLRRSFPAHGYLGTDGPVHYSVKIGGLRVIALDTSVPGQSHGAIGRDQLDWLEATLSAHAGEPAIVALHHPPFDTFIGHMDRIGLLEGSAALEAVIGRHPNVERVICGHDHRAIEKRYGGTIASVCPSPAHQVCLDLSLDAPSAWVLEPPAFRLYALGQDGRVVSHLAPIGDFDGPHPFHESGKLID